MRARYLVAMLWLGLWAGPAWADPFGDWAFDAEKAEKANDLAQLEKLAGQSPGFARIWFYGRVFDLVNENVPQGVRDTQRPQLEALAKGLAAQTPADNLPLMFLDRVDSGVLAEQAPVARKLQEDAIGAVNAGTPVGAALAAIERPELAEWAFHTLFDRAWRSRKRLGARHNVGAYLTVARRMAEGYALALDDLAPFKTLTDWYGEAGLPQERLVLEAQMDLAIGQLLAGQAAEGRATLDAAVSLARSSQGNSLMTALVLNGAAGATGRAGDRPREAALRLQVLQAVRPLGNPALVALAAANLVRTYTAAGDLPSLLPYAKELRELGAPVLEVARHTWALAAAQEALTQGGLAAQGTGDFARAEAYLAEAQAIGQALAEQAVVARAVPAAAVAETLAQRQTKLAALQAASAGLARARGQFALADQGYTAAAATWINGLQRADRATALAADRAEVALLAGDEGAALDHAKAVLQGTPGEDAAVVQARAFHVQARVRLRQGAWAPAFANANRGLEVLRDAGAADQQPALRAALHRTAGVVLHAAGFTAEAIDRLRQAAALAPGDLSYLVPLANALVIAGDAPAAVKALAPAADGPRGRSAQVYQGCALTLGGDHDAALPLLETAKGLTLPHLRDVRYAGLSCLAHALLAKGAAADAERVLAPIRVQAANPGTPAGIAWRLMALDGRIALARKDPLTAARRWLRALDRFAELAAERGERGVTLEARWLAAPATPALLLTEGPTVIAAGAAKAPAKEQSGLHRQAIALALYARALDAAPAGGAMVEGALRPAAAEAAFRAALARSADARALLAEPLLAGNDRVRLLQEEQARASAVATGREAMAQQAPAWSDFFAPLPDVKALTPAADEARLYYHVTDARSELWIMVGGQPLRHYTLPGRADLEKLIQPALDALRTPPQAWAPPEGNTRRRKPKDPNTEAWAMLQAPVTRLLPFLGDKALMEALKGKALRVFPDGPLVRLPFGALVIGAPEAPGQPPKFLQAAHAVRYGVSTQRAAKAPEAAPAKALLAFGPFEAGVGCPKAPGALDLCGGPDQAAEAGELEAAFAVAPDKFARRAGADASAQALAQGLRDAGILWIVGPVDLAGGALLTSPAAGAPYPRTAGLGLGLGAPAATRAVVLARLPERDEGDARGLARLVAALKARGVDQVLINATRAGADPELAGALAARLAAGESLTAALQAAQAADAKAVVDPNVGGPAHHHPYRWGRWILID